MIAVEQNELTDEQTELIETVQAAQQGDRLAFGVLVERYERAVYGIALRRLRNHAEAQELCQDIFVQALRKISQVRDPVCFGGWLRTIANRMAINRIVRRGDAVATDPSSLEATSRDDVTPLDTALARERSRQVRAGLGRLRAMDRETLVAFYMKGQSLSEMSDAFDSPVGTIKRRLHVARKRLARELESMSV